MGTRTQVLPGNEEGTQTSQLPSLRGTVVNELTKPMAKSSAGKTCGAKGKSGFRVRRAVSLFTGAGGMDVGFKRAGFQVIWANDILRDACDTYALNHGSQIRCGNIHDYFDEIVGLSDVELVFGGPPCQGFSVAGKMDPDDARSRLLFSFFDVVERTNPQVFILENVKALGVSPRWKHVRTKLFQRAAELKFKHFELIVLNSTHYGIPQKRERMFFVGIRDAENIWLKGGIRYYLRKYESSAPPVGKFFRRLGPAGTSGNTSLCNAKIALAKDPILRPSAYAGMLFNGAGRPIDANSYANTLPASMGGNKTPIVDEKQVFDGEIAWVEKYHKQIMDGKEPSETTPPSHLRRITVEEASLIQTFPANYKFSGRRSSQYLQIGNAVPCKLAYAVGAAMQDALADEGL